MIKARIFYALLSSVTAIIIVACNNDSGKKNPNDASQPKSQEASASATTESNAGQVSNKDAVANNTEKTKEKPVASDNSVIDQATKPPVPTATSTAKPAEKLTDAQIIDKMKIVPFVPNARTGKIFTGISGATGFAVPIIIAVDGIIPKEIILTKEEADRIYDSKEFLQKMLPSRSKIAIKFDPAFFTMAELEADPDYPERVFALTAIKAGTSAIVASIGTETLTISATTQTYDPAAVQAGAARFATAAGTAPACTSCHDGVKGPTHSPTWLAAYTDAAVLSTIETGINSDDKYKVSLPHAFVMANANLKIGIVAYLRSLPPMP